MVILNEQKIFEVLEDYKKNNDFSNLKETVINLVREEVANLD